MKDIFIILKPEQFTFIYDHSATFDVVSIAFNHKCSQVYLIGLIGF